MDDAELIRGVVIDKIRVHEGMPKKIAEGQSSLDLQPPWRSPRPR